MNTSDFLHKAADIIEERGHASGCGWPGTDTFEGAFCLEGALMEAQGLSGITGMTRLPATPAYRAIRSHLNDALPFMWQDSLPHGWRQPDRPEMGWVGGSEEAAREYAKSRVIEVLRACAAIEAARESEARILGDRPEPVEREVAVS